MDVKEITTPVSVTGRIKVYLKTPEGMPNKLLIDQENQVTNGGISHWTKGHGLSELKYLAVGRGNQAASINDTALKDEFARYLISSATTKGGQTLVLAETDDKLISTIQEFGLFFDNPSKTSDAPNSGILFNRVAAECGRNEKQTLMVEWTITLV